MSKLESFLNPKSVAIIGASSNSQKIGWQILNNLKQDGFKGQVFPVNLNDNKILGFKSFKSINDLPIIPDLVVMAIPAQFVLEEVKKIASIGSKNIIIISAGFGEVGGKGKKMEEEIKEVAQKYNINILGPNCLGLINYQKNINLTFAKSEKQVVKKKYNIAFVSQSGAIGSSVLDWTSNKNIGFSIFVSLGNKAILNENDFLEYFINDKKSDLVVFYLEEISQGEKFVSLVSKLSKIKPVAILKAGRSLMGMSAALSHTGSLAGDSQVVGAALERSGAIILRDMSELFNILRLVKKSLKLMNSDLYVISNAGGPAVISADEAEINKVSLPNFSKKINQELKNFLPTFAKINNPLDVLGDAQSPRYQKVLDKILRNKEIQSVLVILTPQSSTDVDNIAKIIANFSLKYPEKLICTSFIGGPAISRAKKILADGLVPNFDYSEEAIRVLGHYLNYYKNIKSLKVFKVDNYENKGIKIKGNWDYLAAKKLLDKYGLKTVKTEKISLIDELNYPIAVKIVGPNLIHKSDAKAVFTGIPNTEECQNIISNNILLKDKNNYAVSQKMFFGAKEMILGVKRDSNFGPIIMIGWGGVYTELINDSKLFLAEENDKIILEAIKKLKFYKILNGFRGEKKYNIKPLVSAIKSLIRLSKENPDVEELDINPLFVWPEKVLAVDWRIFSKF